MRFTIVTPWHNHPEFADDYFAALRRGMRDGDRALIVDNGSNPRLSRVFADHYRGGVADVRLDGNLGFSKASNYGAKVAATEAVLMLNNDVWASSDTWLDDIRAALEPGVLVGAMLRRDPHADVDGQPMPYLDGWCLAAALEDWAELGGFDETLAEPAYYSDNLLCLEARAAGMTLREVHVGLVHKLNGTAKHDPRVAHASAVNRARYVARARELLSVPA